LLEGDYKRNDILFFALNANWKFCTLTIIFVYFAGKFFRHQDAKTQRYILADSFASWLSAFVAEQLREYNKER